MGDDSYVAIAKSTQQRQAYFKRFANASCAVDRGWDVTINCDDLQRSSVPPYLEKFRVRIDPTTNIVVEVEILTNAP
jgi:hypothetical protein